MATARTVAPEIFILTLDGVASLVKSVDGGYAYAEVVNEPAGPTFFVKKHIGTPKYEDFTVRLGLDMSEALYDWIAASWNMNYMRKDGSVTVADSAFNARTQRQFFHALITETTFPALDSSAKDAAYLTIKFAPEYTRTSKAGGKIPGAAAKKEKLFRASNFRFELDGLDATRVTKIDSFTVKQTVATDDIGDARDFVKEPGKIEFPNLRVTIPDGPTVVKWEDWFTDFVINGKNDEAQQKNGVIHLLGADLKAELARVVLHGVGIFALRRGANRAVVVDLYCEQMELFVGAFKPPKAVPPARLAEGPAGLVQAPSLRVPR